MTPDRAGELLARRFWILPVDVVLQLGQVCGHGQVSVSGISTLLQGELTLTAQIYNVSFKE